MLKAALTGNIASGKSSVARVWQELGALIIDADTLARRVVEPGTPALREIVATWGEEILTANGALDRGALRAIVFRDPAARARLEAIVHPAVGELRDRELDHANARGEPIVVADIPLLFEVGMEDEFDVVVLVDAPETVRLERVMRDRGLDRDTAQKMIDAQMPSKLKRARVDIVIENTGSITALEERAAEVWRELKRRAGLTPAERGEPWERGEQDG